MSDEPPPDLAPLILTLALDAEAQERLDRLRTAHFPAERNSLQAHLTLFHHLPAAHEGAIHADLAAASAARDALILRATEVRFFGRGVAYGFAAPELVALRGDLARRWWPASTEQDRRPFRPHVTVQNKAPAEQARALYDELRARFTPFTIAGTGLLVWRYRGGPWEAAGEYPFTSAVNG
jgi:2'-5' RNA ligase